MTDADSPKNDPPTTEELDTLRRLRVLTAMEGGWTDDSQIVPKLGADAEGHILSLRQRGLIVDARGRSRALSPGHLGEDTPEAREANYAAFVEGVAERFHDDVLVQQRFVKAFRAIKRLHGFHRFHSPRPHLVVPTAMIWSEHGPRPSEALVLLVGDRGVRVLMAREADLVLAADSLVQLRDVEALLPPEDASWQEQLQAMAVLPFAEANSSLPNRITKLSRTILHNAFDDAEAAARFLGVEAAHVQSKAKGLRLTLRLGRSILSSFRGCLWSLLDKEVRRLASAIPNASFDRYDWLLGVDAASAKRRQQAARLYPLLGDHLVGIEGDIDAGSSLDRALSKAVSIPEPNLRRLRGLTRQKAGRAYHDIVAMSPGLRSILGVAKPDHLPPKAGWPSLAALGTFMHTRGEGWIHPPLLDMLFDAGLAKSFLENPEGVCSRLPGVFEALRDAADVADLVASGRWQRSWALAEDAESASSRLLLPVILPRRSLAAIDDLNRRWHRSVNTNIVLLRRWRRLDSATKMLTWLPLAPNWSCVQGRMDWLCDEDAIEIEGMEMAHCVGSYASRCARRLSHVASVTAHDGRATAEFSWDKKARRLQCVQLQARWNTQASEGCYAVVRSFLAAARAGGLLDRRALRIKNGMIEADIEAPVMSAEAREAVTAAYEALFPGFVGVVRALEHGNHANDADCPIPQSLAF